MRVLESPNRAQLERTARRLTPLLDALVFVGGQMAELLVTDPGATRVRPTDDVDVIVTVASRYDYYKLVSAIPQLGFEPDPTPSVPICRHRTADHLVLDVTPTDAAVLGFANLWYPYAIETTTPYRLADDLRIRGIVAPAFLATKWAAFAGRGAGDYLASHDVEDIIAVAAGRPTIAVEVADTPADVRRWIAGETRTFLSDAWADDVLAGSLPDARQLPELLAGVRRHMTALARSDREMPA